MKRIVLGAAIAVTLTGAAMAQQARPLSETVMSFEQRGYDVRSAEDDGRSHEVEAVSPDGRRIEAIVDAVTGEVLSEHPDD